MSKARGLADLGNVYNDGALSNRNLIINGAMQVAQRGTSVALVSSTSQYLVDRFRTYFGHTATGTMSQDTSAPAGFQRSLKVTIGTGAAAAANSELNFIQGLEGFTINPLAIGTADAKQFTISFWVKSSLTGTFGMGVQSQGAVDSYATSYTISTANTWEHKSVTIDGRTSGTWASGNTAGMFVIWDLGAGTNFETTADTWGTGNKYTVAGATKVTATSGATWQITGVQLEVGDTATPFEHRSYGQELALCQRYFQELCPKTGTNEAVATGSFYSTTGFYAPVTLPVEMRADPTGTVFNQSSFKVFVAGAAITTSPVTLSTSSHRKAVEIEAVTAVNTAGRSGFLRTSGVPVPSIQLDAEL